MPSEKMREISPYEFSENTFKAIGKDWMLVTAGNEESFNTMTVSWGGMGILWNKPVVFAFIRPQRYTFEFLEKGEYFTMTGYPDEFKDCLRICGSKSGRDIDKVKETGLTPVFGEKAPYFEQAKLVLVCRKLYSQDLNEESIIDDTLKSNYNGNDYHRMYVAEIVKVLVND